MRTVRFTLRLPPPLQKKLDEKAKEAGLSRNAYIIIACMEFLRTKQTEWRIKD